MKTRFFAIALFSVVVFMIIGSLVSAGAILATSGIGSGLVLSASPGLVALDREYFNLLTGQFGKGAPSPSYLRVEQALSNTKTRYKFDIKKTGAELATERKLDRNDVFIVTHLGVYLIAQVSTTIGLEVLQAYANPEIFVGATGFTPEHLNTIYSGHLEVKIGQKVNIEALDMNKFRYVPTSQQQTDIPYSEFDLDSQSYWPGSLLFLHGTQNIEVFIDMPSITALAWAAVAADTSNKIVLYPMGYLVKNASK
ncbi:hypothetical protein ES705_06381 [subsurface metagenome]